MPIFLSTPQFSCKKEKKTFGRSICVTPLLVHPQLLSMVHQVEKLQKGKRHLTPVRMAIIKKSTNNTCWREYGEQRTLLHCWWECKLIQPLWRTVCVCVLVAQLCLTLCNPMDYSPPGCSVYGIFQARILECVAISFSKSSMEIL